MRLKLKLRSEFLKKLKSQTRFRARERSLVIQRKLFRLSQIKNASVICCYASLPEEVGTRSIIRKFLKDGKTVLMPAADTKKKKLFLYEIKDFKKDLRPGTYGISEPDPERTRRAEAAQVQCVIVPGVVFDRCNNRIGRGGGFYDRFLKEDGGGIFKIGLCFSFQLTERIPKDKHDIPMDIILTD